MKYLVLLLLFVTSCTCATQEADPNHFRRDVEDALRYQMATERISIYYLSMRQHYNRDVPYEEYNQLLRYIEVNKRMHAGLSDTWYSAIKDVELHIDEYEPDVSKHRLFRNLINTLYSEYHQVELNLSPWKKIGHNKFEITDYKSGKSAVLTLEKQNPIIIWR